MSKIVHNSSTLLTSGNSVRYELLETVGEGTYAKVQLARNEETKEMAAVKIIQKQQVFKRNTAPQVKKEITIMAKLKHARVAQIKEVLASETEIFIVMEYVPGGDLRSKTISKGGKFSEDEARKYFRQIIEGLDYIHSRGVCHRDLKPENLLLDADGNIKISDFGLSNFVSGSLVHNKPSLLQTACGTPYYVAPEVLAQKGYDGKAADVWSSGIILYNLLTGSFPFTGKALPELFNNITRAKFKCPPWFSPEVATLMHKLLAKDPKERISTLNIQETAWYNQRHDSQTDTEDTPAPCGQTPARTTTTTTTTTVSETKVKVHDGKPDEPVPEASALQAPTLNAFDLMNLVGGLAIGNLFNYHKGCHSSWKRSYDFQSNLSVEGIISGMKLIMQESDMSTLQKATDTTLRFSVTRKRRTFTLTAEIFAVLNKLNVVKIQRKDGDAVAYHKFMARIGPEISKLIGSSNQGPSGISVCT